MLLVEAEDMGDGKENIVGKLVVEHWITPTLSIKNIVEFRSGISQLF